MESLEYVKGLTGEVREMVTEAYVNGFHATYALLILTAVVTVVVSLGIREKHLQ